MGLIARSMEEFVVHLLLDTFLLFLTDLWLAVYIHCK